MVNIKIVRITPTAKIPAYAHSDDACFDIYSDSDIDIFPGETVKIKTGLRVEVPIGYKMSILPRSGLSYNTKLRIANSPGTIDPGYRGEVQILLQNTEQSSPYIRIPTSIRKGDRIAQGEVVPVYKANFIDAYELSETERGEGGFGSTGN